MMCSTSTPELHRLKATRKYSTKVKTGCRTCKIRRIKCDERKPTCARCTSTGRKCDGYTQDESSNPQSLVSGQSSSSLSTVTIFSGLGDSALYLEFYYHCARPTLASNFDRDFWSHTVLQMAQSESSIRHAVIALSYLVKTEPGNLKQARAASLTDSRRPLLLHYNKAVRCLVDRIAQSSHSVEVGLVACLLFTCIEFLRGEYHVAFTHLYNGLKIIAEWRQRPLFTLKEVSSSPSSSVAIAEKVDGRRRIGGNLVPMFIRVMATGLLFGAPFEPLLDNLCPRAQNLKGCAFTSVMDAQLAIYDLRNTTVVLVGVITQKLYAGISPTTEDLQYHAHLLTCHESWFQALTSLECGGGLSAGDRIVASSLKISHYATYIALAGALDVHQISFDAHIASFKALNQHAKIVLDSMDLPTSSLSASAATPSNSPSSFSDSKTSTPSLHGSKAPAAHFTFEISLIFPLYFAVMRCRCPTTRRESVSFLERNPPREALWDAEQHALVARRVIAIEESEMDGETGRPVPATRLANAVIHGDMDKNGGFWVSFTTASWIVGGRVPQDPSRHRGESDPLREDSEWDEWFVMPTK
ncbi:uncharacterized protein K460DRAFT_394764 [Cucurbitaria berberidis CBS 394.84]|uniref:Zn(2)-C6 fungal-type domain-containing protein n=1 Tax=Cucurbitaria berberidis CBS 394.84 TaxID=1168544 RepID=A0A9P4GG92_9PLEO|nr:uncharacterized protein K460DRAFT_394764 [Cucurbitaria berberidis CBS 394.84]KAF1845010.1 hypothetical protein K460DRAFT_394764 [Cucurbitaria berberidis CBS 394.84]